MMAYALYKFSASNVPADKSMMLTIPFVVFGLFRYLFIMSKSVDSESPELLPIPLSSISNVLSEVGLGGGILLGIGLTGLLIVVWLAYRFRDDHRFGLLGSPRGRIGSPRRLLHRLQPHAVALRQLFHCPSQSCCTS